MIYLDNAATSNPKAPTVTTALLRYLEDGEGNPGRASHRRAREASEVVFETREKLAALLSVPDAERIVFTKNATEALNLALCGFLRAGDSVAVSSLEHNAVMRPLRRLEAFRGVKILVFGCDRDGRPHPEELEAALSIRPRLCVTTLASNVTGAILPVAEIAERCARDGIPVGVDASQAIGHQKISAPELGAAFIGFSGHKGLLAPTGTGALYAAPGFDPDPLVSGGTGSLSESERMPEFLPDRYEAGTLNVLGLAGLRASLSFLEETGIDRIRTRESEICDRLIQGFSDIPGLTTYGPHPGVERASVVSVTAERMSSADIALELDRRDIAVRSGLHCAPAAHRAIGTFDRGGTVRFSPGFFTTDAEIDETVRAMKEILES